MGIGTVIGALVSILVAILVVSALAFGFIYLLRVMQNRSIGAADLRAAGPGMRFLRALPLGQSERLMLVEVGEEVLLLGVAAHGVTLLKSWPVGDPAMAPAAEAQPSSASDLADRFRALPGLRRRPAEPSA